MNYQQWLQHAAQALNQANPAENGKTDAQVLLQFVTQKSRAFILHMSSLFIFSLSPTT